MLRKNYYVAGPLGKLFSEKRELENLTTKITEKNQ